MGFKARCQAPQFNVLTWRPPLKLTISFNRLFINPKWLLCTYHFGVLEVNKQLQTIYYFFALALFYILSSIWLNIIKLRKIRKTEKNNYFLMSVASLYTPCFVMFCVFLYGPFCHGTHKLDLSTLFTTFFLWTSLPFILSESNH